MKASLVVFILVFISGCANNVSQSNLYWGNYSKALELNQDNHKLNICCVALILEARLQASQYLEKYEPGP